MCINLPKENKNHFLMTYISAHTVLFLHFTLLGVQTVVGGAAVLLAACPQAFRWRYRVVLQKNPAEKQTCFINS